jgi:UDP-3-O-[3-hydroxymyristoyl] glucosamine N-acyltransferase
MADERFFQLAGPFNLSELANIAGAETAGSDCVGRKFVDVAPLSSAGPDHVSFLDNKKYIDAFTTSGAGACLVHPSLAKRAPKGMALLVTDQPYHGYARVASAFYPGNQVVPGIHNSAVVSASAVLGDNVQIAAGVYIGENVTVGSNTQIGANTVVEQGVKIGSTCRIAANVTLQCCDVGDSVILHPGVCIGQDGFGFAMGAGGHEKVPQLGRVSIGDDVEIGANTTVDRGTGPDTIIGAGCKIDNQVQIGHNARLGQGCVLVAQSGVSGSTEVGNYTVIGGQVGIAGHLKIGDGVQIAAKSGVMRDIESGTIVGGTPSQPMKSWLRSVAAIERLGKKKGKINE